MDIVKRRNLHTLATYNMRIADSYELLQKILQIISL